MRTDIAAPRGITTRGFETIADAIMYRWSVERDTWVSPTELEHARVYLEHAGIVTTLLPDGRYVVEGQAADVLGAARVVLLGLKHLHAARKAAGRSDR